MTGGKVQTSIRDVFGDRELRESDWLPYEEWERLLKRAARRDPTTGEIGFPGALGPALAARYEWLKTSRAANLPPAEAERRFCERIDRERAEQRYIENESARLRAQAAPSKASTGRRRGQEAEI